MSSTLNFGRVVARRISSQNCAWAVTPEGLLIVVNPSRMIVEGGGDPQSEKILPDVSNVTIAMTEGNDSLLDDKSQYVGEAREDLLKALRWVRGEK